MLSRKQLWRRIKSFQSSEEANEQPSCQIFGNYSNEKVDFDALYASKNLDNLEYIPRLKSAVSTTNLSRIEKRRNERRVKIASVLKVCLIQSRNEFLIASGGADNLYWSSGDCNKFKKDAFAEVKEFSIRKNIPINVALKLLYQPDLEDAIEEDARGNDLNSEATEVGSDQSVQASVDTSVTQSENFISKIKSDVEVFNERAAVIKQDGISLTNQTDGSDAMWEIQWHKPKPLKILVVDDSVVCLKVISSTLKKLDHLVVTATRGDVACGYVRSNSSEFDVIIVDLMMPVVDGATLIKSFKALGVKCPIIVMTSLDEENDLSGIRRKSKVAGADVIVQKPANAINLCAAFKEFVQLSSDSKQGYAVADCGGGLSTQESPVHFDLSSADDKTDAESSPLKRLNILVVDDSKVCLKVISSTLKKLGNHQVTVLERGDLACDHLSFEPNKYDVLIVDLLMPDMDGVQLIGALRATGVTSPIIVMTSIEDHNDVLEMRRKSIAAGAYSVLHKPVRISDLFAVLNDVSSSIQPGSLIKSASSCNMP